MHLLRLLPMAATLLLSSALLSGCALTGSDVINPDEVKDLIKNRARDNGYKATDIKCPEISTKEGTVAHCTGKFDGVPQKVRVTVGKSQGDNKYYTKILVLQNIEADGFESMLASTGADVDCQDGQSAEAGETIRCDLDFDGEKGSLMFKVGKDNDPSTVYLQRAFDDSSSVTLNSKGDVVDTSGPAGKELAKVFKPVAQRLRESFSSDEAGAEAPIDDSAGYDDDTSSDCADPVYNDSGDLVSCND
jgi:hypothetical protein